MMVKNILFFLFFACCTVEYKCARILCYFNVGQYSRTAMFQALADELVRRGHELVVLTPRPRPRSDLLHNLTEIDVSITTTNTRRSQASRDDYNILRLKHLKSTLNEFEQQLQTKGFQEIIRSKSKYDLLIVDGSLGSPGLVLSNVFQIPAVLMRPTIPYLREHELVSSEMHALFLYLTRTVSNVLPTRTRFLDAASQIYSDYQFRRSFLEAEAILDDILKRNFGVSTPSIKDLWKNVHALLVTNHRQWDHNVSVPPNMIYLGNILQKPEKDLPEDIQTYLDASIHGAVLLSFGSNYDFTALPDAKINMFLDVFAALPYDVIIKCEKQLRNTPGNVRIYKWLPQTDVLRHPKVKLFITQGGMHSTDEAISAGVPLLGVPMYGDQWHNADQYVTFKIGHQLNLDSLTEQLLLNTITAIIEDPSYSEATRRLRAQFEHRFDPMERAVRAVERVLRGACAHPPRAPHPAHTYERYPELPLLAAAALVLLVLLTTVIYLINFTATLYQRVLQINFI